jgi:gliding motility-associated-like protein
VTNDAPLLYELDSTLVTWTITDVNGNTATATQFVIIADSTAPSISAPLPVTAYVDTLCQTTIDSLGTPITSDNCSVDTVYNDAPATYTTGNYVITWYAEDAAGNIDSTTQVVTIVDTIRPEPILVDTTLTLDPSGPISLFGSDIDAGSTDNCGVDVVILEQNSFDCNDLGTNTVGVRVIDINGNVYDTSIVVTVEESGIDLDFDQIDDACDDNVNTTTVIVPSGFTPNGDGINDQLIIPALSNYTTINLVVYNRYGNVVYEASPYANDWDGTNGKSGMELPDGTYFYTLELDGGEILNGYIYINRTL